jgi:transcriptional regulator with XRE-family HTH domain
MSPVAERFATNLRSAREAAGISQEEPGFLSSLHRTEIGQLERGGRIPRIDSLAQLCGALEVEYAVLMAGIYWTAPPALRGGGFGVARASQ